MKFTSKIINFFRISHAKKSKRKKNVSRYSVLKLMSNTFFFIVFKVRIIAKLWLFKQYIDSQHKIIQTIQTLTCLLFFYVCVTYLTTLQCVTILTFLTISLTTKFERNAICNWCKIWRFFSISFSLKFI